MIFTPNDNTQHVATIRSSQDARNASFEQERENYERDHALRERDMRDVGFGRRESVCG